MGEVGEKECLWKNLTPFAAHFFSFTSLWHGIFKKLDNCWVSSKQRQNNKANSLSLF